MLLSGAAHFAPAGPPAFITIWDRTASNMKVKGVAAMTSIPMYLNTKAPHLKSLKDLTPNDKIAVTAVKVSIPAIIMQMQAIKECGKADYAQYDPYTVSLQHPDGVVALLSGKSRSRRTSPRRRSISASGKRPGGPHDHDVERDHGRAVSTFTMLYAPTKFHDENPKAYAAVLKALQAAIDFINADKNAAAEVFLKSDEGKGWKLGDLMEDPQRSGRTLHHLAGKRDDLRELHGRCRLDQAAAGEMAGHVLPGNPSACRGTEEEGSEKRALGALPLPALAGRGLG